MVLPVIDRNLLSQRHSQDGSSVSEDGVSSQGRFDKPVGTPTGSGKFLQHSNCCPIQPQDDSAGRTSRPAITRLRLRLQLGICLCGSWQRCCCGSRGGRRC